jgi:UDP-2-acetamido-3-amino-2,3-dideoxy-glucuronate N-acetyltransferase
MDTATGDTVHKQQAVRHHVSSSPIASECDLISPSADVASQAIVATSARIWDLAQIRESAVIGDHVVIGRGAYVGVGVTVGDNSKIQNHALVYEPAHIGSGVFIGPAAVLTNDRSPRAVNPDGSQKDASQWESVGVIVEEGASIGARAVCVAPVRIGAWAMVAAGAVVTKDVAPHALVVGVPARQVAWVNRLGQRLLPDQHDPSVYHCPHTGAQFRESNGTLHEVSP